MTVLPVRENDNKPAAELNDELSYNKKTIKDQSRVMNFFYFLQIDLIDRSYGI